MNDQAPPGQIPAQAQGQDQEQEQGEQANKIQAIHDEVKNAKDAMEITAMKLQERGELMDDLQHKTDKLSIQGQNFKSTAAKTRRRMWIQNMKWTICLALFIILMLSGIIVGAVRGTQIAKEKVVEHVSSVEAMPATSTSTTTSGTGTNVTASPDPSP